MYKLSPKVVNEIKSIAATFITLLFAFLATDGANVLNALWNGHFTSSTFLALAMAPLRSDDKALLTIIFPKLFKRN